MSTAALWALLDRPLDPIRAAEALLGISHNAAKVMTNALFVTSPEVDFLLDELPHMVRSLTISSALDLEICHAEVRGPIQWAETMSVRAGSAGDQDYFVCSSPQRAYDTPENRVLVAALQTIVEAASVVDTGSLRQRDTPMARQIRGNAVQARRYLDHRALSGVPRVRPTQRDRGRTRSGTRRRVYAPAMDVLTRAAEPMTADEVSLVADADTVSAHAVAVETVSQLRDRGHPVPPLRIRDRVVTGGIFLFVHPNVGTPIGSHHGVLVNGQPIAAESPAEVASALDALGL